MPQKSLFTVILAIVLAALFCGCTDHSGGPSLSYYSQIEKQVFSNAVTFQAAVRGGDEQGALDEMSELLEDINSQMSLSLSSAAITRFNALGKDYEGEEDGYVSEKVEISANTYEVITRSIEFYDDTDGAFDISVYPLVRLWNVDSEGLSRYGLFGADDPPPPPTEQKVNELLSACDLGALKTEQADGRYFIYKTNPRLEIDLGAVAKGYAADKCIGIAKAHGVQSALINISGNICLLGEWYHPEQRRYVPWQLGVTSPRPRGGLAGNLCALSVVGDKTLVTSGDYARFYETDGLFVPHIIDGKSGLPLGVAYSDGVYSNTPDHIISATIICEDSAMADAYATAVCLMGYEKAKSFLSSRGVGGIIITADGKLCLIGVSLSDDTADVHLTLKDSYHAYADYRIEEVAFG